MLILKTGLVALIPVVCGSLGDILDGIISDALLRCGASLSMVCKVPVVLGTLLSMTMMICNYVDAQVVVVTVTALSPFGGDLGALDWAVSSDAAPKQITGLSGALMNALGNLSSITMPTIIGYIVNATGSFNGALVYVGIHALVVIVCYLFIVGGTKRVELKPL